MVEGQRWPMQLECGHVYNYSTVFGTRRNGTSLLPVCAGNSSPLPSSLPLFPSSLPSIHPFVHPSILPPALLVARHTFITLAIAEV